MNRKMLRSVVPRKLLMEAAHNKDELKYNELFDNAIKIRESLAREQHFIRGITGMNPKSSKKTSWDPVNRNLRITTQGVSSKNNSTLNPGLQVSVLNNNRASSPGLPNCSTPDLSKQKRITNQFTFIGIDSDRCLAANKQNSSKLNMRKLTEISN